MNESFIRSYLIQPVFFGFGIITSILIYFNTVLKINTERLIKSSIEIIKYSGILFLFLWIINIASNEVAINRFTGKYWFSGWFMMFTYPVLSQLFWINKVKNSTLLIYLISILFIVSNLIFSGKIICFDGDCDINSLLIEILVEIGIYILILSSLTYIMKNEK